MYLTINFHFIFIFRYAFHCSFGTFSRSLIYYLCECTEVWMWFHWNVTHSERIYCREWVSFPWWGAQLFLHNGDCFALISSGQQWTGSIGPEWKLIPTLTSLYCSVFSAEYLLRFFFFFCWLWMLDKKVALPKFCIS